MKKMKFKHTASIRQQLITAFIITFFIPVSALLGIGSFFAYYRMKERYTELTQSEQRRAASIVFDLTSSVYNEMDGVVIDSQLSRLFSEDQDISLNEKRSISSRLGQIESETRVFNIRIYTNNPSVSAFGRIYYDENLSKYDWYQKRIDDSYAQWVTTPMPLNRIQELPCLTLVIRIHKPGDAFETYLVCPISYNYLNNRINSPGYYLMMTTDPEESFYSSQYRTIGQPLLWNDFDGTEFSTCTGELICNGAKALAALGSFRPYTTTSMVYILAMDTEASHELKMQQLIFFVSILLISAGSVVIMLIFINYLSKRISIIRNSIHEISQGRYELMDKVSGDDELSQIFGDLKVTADHIRDVDREYYQEIIQNQEMQNRQQQMEYKMLVSQINPHYLYNTLEMIHMQASAENAPDTATSVMYLARTMHYALDSYSRQSVTLSEELANVDYYLHIQKQRFGDRVNWNTYIDDSCRPEQYRMLPLLLMPIVENAVTHGLENRLEDGHISIIAEAENDELTVSVADNGNGMTEEELSKTVQRMTSTGLDQPGHVGLKNTYQRIRLFYGEEYGLSVTSKPGSGTIVTMNLPFGSKQKQLFSKKVQEGFWDNAGKSD